MQTPTSGLSKQSRSAKRYAGCVLADPRITEFNVLHGDAQTPAATTRCCFIHAKIILSPSPKPGAARCCYHLLLPPLNTRLYPSRSSPDRRVTTTLASTRFPHSRPCHRPFLQADPAHRRNHIHHTPTSYSPLPAPPCRDLHPCPGPWRYIHALPLVTPN